MNALQMFDSIKPIHLIGEDGNETGPHSDADIDLMIEDGEITAANYAWTDGMPEWRSVNEALIWARAPMLTPHRAAILPLLRECAAGKTDIRDVRVKVLEMLAATGVWPTQQIAASLGVVLDLNLNLIHGLKDAEQGVTDGAAAPFPARELFAQITTETPRDWPGAWVERGGQIHEGKMIARKDSPVWLALSDFGFPCPPFSADQGYWVRDISRSKAVAFGLVASAERIGPISIPEFVPILM